METVYFYCAAIGGGFLILQVLLMLISGGESDFDGDASPELDVGEIDASYVLFQLSLKTVIAFVTFFGIAGMACTKGDVSTSATLAVALAAGLGAFMMIGYCMQAMMALQSRGNINMMDAKGQSAKVDLRIPENHTGSGKIIVIVGGRMLNKKAVTKGDAIPTGAEVVVDGMTAPDTYEVSLQQ
ncbi:MAG: hypothetical protein ACI89X_000181 [Planctomycetota bacterium]|jgi:hypothetical protein